MTSSMLPGDRRPASTRKSGMTVLGKVPKPINLPSQRLENQGNDPNVEIVPKGTFTWGSRSSSTVPNAWGTSSISSPTADGSLSSPSGARPSTAGSDRSHEPSNAWGPNPHPSSASGVLASGQYSALSSRPRSAETRSASSQLSRFADSSADNPVALLSPGIAERSGVGSSKGSGFNLSSGDFPTLHADKNSDTNSQRGHSSQGRPLSSQGRPSSSQNRPTSASGPESRQNDGSDTNITGDKNVDGPNHGTVNSWKADNPHYAHHGPPPNIDHWHRDSHQTPPYPNMNVPPHYNSWHNPQFHQGPADGSWYNRGGPPGGPPGGPYRQPIPPGGQYRPPSPHGGYPIDYPPGPPRPLFYEPYPRPYLQPEQYRGPGHPDIRPGAYSRPMAHEGFYGPPRPNFYGPADREASIMGMAPPAVHNQYPPQNQNFSPANFHGRPSGYGTGAKNNEQGKPDHVHDIQGKYRVLLKQNDGPEDQRRDWGSRSQLQETMDFDSQSRDNSVKNTGIESAKAADGLLKNPEAATVDSREIQQYPAIKKNPTLLEKVEQLNNKARTSDSRSSFTEKANAESVDNPKEPNVFIEDKKQESSNHTKVCENSQNTHFVDQKKTHVSRTADYHYKPKSNKHEITSEWTKKVPEVESSVNATIISSKSGLNEFNSASVDQVDDLSAQRAKMREVAIQRAKQLQQEEEERTREQKAKALAKLEELNRRTLTENSSLKSSQASSQSIGVHNIVKQDSLASGTLSSDATSGEAISATSAEKTETVKPVEEENIKKSTDIFSNVETKAKQNDIRSTASGLMTNAAPVIASITIGTIEIQPNQITKEKQLSYRKKQSIQKEMVIFASTIDAAPNNKDLLVQDQNSNKESSKNSKKYDVPNSNLIPALQTESSKSASTPSEGLNKIQTTEVTDKVNSHSKSQAQRKSGRNQHANIISKQTAKHHSADTVMWAPVKPQSKNETSSHGGENNITVSESTEQSEKRASHVINGSKAKRAEMERYVPKPVAKELSQQVNLRQISQDIEKGDKSKHGKHAKANNAWRQRVPNESDPQNNVQVSNSEDDAAPRSNVTTTKQRRQPYKANRAHVSDPHATSDSENHNASIKSHWQPKAQVKQNDTSSQGTENVQKGNTPVVAEAGESSQNQGSKTESRTSDFSDSNVSYTDDQRGRVQRGYNPNYRNHDDRERNLRASDGNKRVNSSNILHDGYQRTGPNDEHEDSFEGRRGPGSRYRGRGRNYQRGGGNFHARGMSTRVGNDI